MKNIFLISCLGFSACSLDVPEITPTRDNQIYVRELVPTEDLVAEDQMMSVGFSEKLDVDETDISDFAFIEASAAEEYLKDDWQKLADAIHDGKIISYAASVFLSEDRLSVDIVLSSPPAGNYLLLVFPSLVSDARYPLNQTVAGGVEKYFFRNYIVKDFSSVDSTRSETEAVISVPTTEESESVEKPAVTNPPKPVSRPSPVSPTTESTPVVTESAPAVAESEPPYDSTESTLPADPITAIDSPAAEPDPVDASEPVDVFPSLDPEETVPETEGEESFSNPVTEVSETTTAPLPFWQGHVFISEVVTDPQQDHAESSPGNGILFDPVPGAGSVGSTDEYIEIVNATDASVDLSQWSLEMHDGTDVAQFLSDPLWQTYFSLGGNSTDVASGEVVVLGNPTGDMKNAITVSLKNESGEVIDELFIEDGNANSIADESFTLDGNGDSVMGEATPGEFEF